MTLGGHWHINKKLDWEGIPAIIARSNLRGKDSTGGYNIITFKDSVAFFQSKKTFSNEIDHWATIPLKNHYFKTDSTHFMRPSYNINLQFPQVKEVWRYQIKADVGGGFALYKNVLVTPDTKGFVHAFDIQKQKLLWQFKTNGKIYSTPAIDKNKVIATSSDGNIYCINLNNGDLLWKKETQSAIVTSPVIENNHIFVGSSGGTFRCLDITNGKQIWSYDNVKDFVITTPTIHHGVIYFGSWGNELYALDIKTGKEKWKYHNGFNNRMLSPAACIPQVAENKVFIVSPDRTMTAIDINTGQRKWSKKWENDWVRESMGISKDKKLIFAKTMQGDIIGIPSNVDNNPDYTWKTNFSLGYELNPAPVKEFNDLIFALSDKGVVAAYARKDGQIEWAHKVSNTLVNMIQPISSSRYVLTTMDGKVIIIEVKKQ